MNFEKTTFFGLPAGKFKNSSQEANTWCKRNDLILVQKENFYIAVPLYSSIKVGIILRAYLEKFGYIEKTDLDNIPELDIDQLRAELNIQLDNYPEISTLE